jgi:YHS domain-containing protein
MGQTIRFAIVGLVIGSLVVVAGCNNATGSRAAVTANPDDTKSPSASIPSAKKGGVAARPDEEHGHKPGQHGGIMISIGRDNYHAEAVFEKGGLLRLYTLGQDETRLLEVDRQPLTAYIKIEGETEAEPFELQPVPQHGDAADKTSQFIGKIPAGMIGKRVEVTIPILRIGNERFRIGFKSAPEAHVAADMPAGVSSDEERKLYLTPGGNYTAADIEANGNVTPSQKFKGQMASHDMKPKPGDKICPITATKANAKFTWIIGGKSYEFCCPPCIDEFVMLAKDRPDQIKDPESYLKK